MLQLPTEMLVSIAEADDGYMLLLLELYVDIPAVEERYAAGEQVLTFDEHPQLAGSGLRLRQDGGAVGCGGKIWIAGECLAHYVLDHPETLCPDSARPLYVLELGSGTGLVGLVAGLVARQLAANTHTIITDIDALVPLMAANVELNGLERQVTAATLSWGEPLPAYLTAPAPDSDLRVVDCLDLVVAADCVYLESAFPLLEHTLLALTDARPGLTVLMCYRKRRKGDKKFFRHVAKSFVVTELEHTHRPDHYRQQRTHLFTLKRK